MKNRSMHYREAGQPVKSGHDTCFSKHVIFGKLSLSLDIIKRRLMVSGIVNRIRQSFQIPLTKTKLISVKKTYKNIYAGQLKKRKLEEFLDTIYLQVEFQDERQTIHIPVFDRASDDLNDLPETEKKLLYWQDLLSELRLIKEN